MRGELPQEGIGGLPVWVWVDFESVTMGYHLVSLNKLCWGSLLNQKCPQVGGRQSNSCPASYAEL